MFHPAAVPFDRRTLPRSGVGLNCVLVHGAQRSAVTLTDISGSGACVAGHPDVALGALVQLYHPEAGTQLAHVARLGLYEIGLSFTLSPASIDFALRVVGLAMAERTLAQAGD